MEIVKIQAQQLLAGSVTESLGGNIGDGFIQQAPASDFENEVLNPMLPFPLRMD